MVYELQLDAIHSGCCCACKSVQPQLVLYDTARSRTGGLGDHQRPIRIRHTSCIGRMHFTGPSNAYGIFVHASNHTRRPRSAHDHGEEPEAVPPQHPSLPFVFAPSGEHAPASASSPLAFPDCPGHDSPRAACCAPFRDVARPSGPP